MAARKSTKSENVEPEALSRPIRGVEEQHDAYQARLAVYIEARDAAIKGDA